MRLQSNRSVNFNTIESNQSVIDTVKFFKNNINHLITFSVSLITNVRIVYSH